MSAPPLTARFYPHPNCRQVTNYLEILAHRIVLLNYGLQAWLARCPSNAGEVALHCCTADRPSAGSLSWVECDGWAIDTGNAGHGRPVTILRESEFRNDECSPFGSGLTTAAWSQRTQGARQNSPFADSQNLFSRLYRRRAV